MVRLKFRHETYFKHYLKKFNLVFWDFSQHCLPPTTTILSVSTSASFPLESHDRKHYCTFITLLLFIYRVMLTFFMIYVWLKHWESPWGASSWCPLLCRSLYYRDAGPHRVNILATTCPRWKINFYRRKKNTIQIYFSNLYRLFKWTIKSFSPDGTWVLC